MELVFLWVNFVMLIIVTGFGASIVWRWTSNKSIESQITSLSLAILLVIGAIAQLILAIILGESIILAILEIIIWIINVISLSIYLRVSIKRNKKQCK